MPLNIKELEGYAELMAEFERMQQLTQKLEKEYAHPAFPPAEKMLRSEANKLFVGRGGKPVDRHTFARMVNGWQAEGKLQEGVNMWNTAAGLFISTDFLRGQILQPKTKLRRA